MGNRDRLVAASCPAGPAFEGGGIACGMPGQDGAIESMVWKNGQFNYRVIGGGAPQGLCGSGLIDLLAELRRHDMMTEKGVFADRKQYEMMVVPEHGIALSREDASNLAQGQGRKLLWAITRHARVRHCPQPDPSALPIRRFCQLRKCAKCD